MKKLNIMIWKIWLVIGIITGIIIITFFTSQTKENGESKPKETNGEVLSAVGTISGSWKKLANPPFPLRNSHNLVYASNLDHFLLFGGTISYFSEKLEDYLNDVWSYDPSTGEWSKENPQTSPPPRWLHGIVYVPETNQAVLFGGSNIGDTLDDTWIYDTIKRDWFYQKPQESSYPAKRNAFAMVYASIPKRVILFGGARTCELRPDLLVGISCAYNDDTWAYDPTTNNWSIMKSGVGDSPHPRSDFAMAYDSHTDKVVLFGGNVDPSGAGGPEYTLADTWFYDYTTNKWKEMKPKVSPHGRIGHSMVYDKNIERIVLFGGLDGYQIFNDVWIYDVNTNTWEQIAINSSTSPSPRAYAAMEFDPIRKRILLHGGVVYEQEGVPGDFWEFIITSR